MNNAPEKSAREMLQEAVNANLLNVAARGFNEIDAQANRVKASLKSLGISNAEEFVDALTARMKYSAVELMTGRPQGPRRIK